MSTTISRTPLDDQARAARRERVQALADRVTWHLANGSLATDPQADLDLERLSWEVGGMAKFVQAKLIDLVGEQDGTALTQGWLVSSLGEADEVRALAALERGGVDRVAVRARELNQLCLTAQQALEAALVQEQPVADDPVKAQLLCGVLDAEDRGDRRGTHRARRRLEQHAGSLKAVWQQELGRARRDRNRRLTLAAAS